MASSCDPFYSAANITAPATEYNNPRANVFIMVNLGCEMLYVIDQRLKAQQIVVEKSIQVMHDVTSVLLEPKFIDSLITGSTQPQAQLLSEDRCKFMLKDIATCSLMRLDEGSMDKLWNLMTMLYKWQLFHTKHQYQLMDITIRHLAEIGKLYPEEKHLELIDYTKNTLLDFWNSCSDEEQQSLYTTNINWLEKFQTKISLLIRLGFQALDGSFFDYVNQPYFAEFLESIGENIYTKSSDKALQKSPDGGQSYPAPAKCVDQLADMLNCRQSVPKESESEDFKPIDFKVFQKQFEKNLQQCNILFNDLDVNVSQSTATATAEACSSTTPQRGGEEFVYLNATYNKQNVEASPHYSNIGDTTTPAAGAITKDLLEMYSKLK